jgi:WhiB family redox-sensing transcriptional regulator
MNWRKRAACLDEDPELFFPTGSTGPRLEQVAAAKIICHRCKVVESCLKFAVDFDQEAGVWGGLSADERGALNERSARLTA